MEHDLERQIDMIANRLARLEHLTEHVAVTQLFFFLFLILLLVFPAPEEKSGYGCHTSYSYGSGSRRMSLFNRKINDVCNDGHYGQCAHG